jgi:recombination protein RecA
MNSATKPLRVATHKGLLHRDLGVKAGVVEKSGAWFSYDSQRLGQGRENAKTFLKQNPDAAARIEMAIRENAGLIAEKILDAGPEDDAE